MSLYSVIIKRPEVHGEILYRIPLRHDELVDKIQLLKNKSAGNEITGEVDLHRKLGERYLAEAEEKLTLAEETRKAAEEFLAYAREEAQKIRAEARLGLEDEKAAVLAEAKAAGFAEGHREGMAKAAAEDAAIREKARDVLRQSEEICRKNLEALENGITGLAVEISEKLLEAQLTLAPDTVCAIAKESLRLVEDRQMVYLYINPAELPIYESKVDELKSLLPPRAELQVLTDSAMAPGGCRIETESGTVDATMETRRGELMRVLFNEEG